MAGIVPWFMSLWTWPKFLVWFIGATIGAVTMFVLTAVYGTGPTVVVSTMRETDGVVVQGGRLNLFIVQDKYRDCPTSTARYLWRMVDDPDKPGEHVRFYVPLSAAGVPLAPVGIGQRYIISISLPSDIQQGDGWFYQSRSDRDCGWLPQLSARVTVQSPSVPLRVLSEVESLAQGVMPQEGTVVRPDMRP